jgi:asparagine synthase (glutamine-hydrolysing)
VPLLDHELVELAGRIPETVKIKGGRLKHVLKEALGELLPEDILERKKRGFGTPMGAWLRGDLAPLRDTLLSDEAIRARGLFEPACVRQLIAEHEQNRSDGTDRILALLNLEIWSRIYLDGRSAADVTDELKAELA